MTEHPVTRIAADIAAAGAVVGSLMGVLPYVAAALGVLWYGVLFYDRFWRKK